MDLPHGLYNKCCKAEVLQGSGSTEGILLSGTSAYMCVCVSNICKDSRLSSDPAKVT